MAKQPWICESRKKYEEIFIVHCDNAGNRLGWLFYVGKAEYFYSYSLCVGGWGTTSRSALLTGGR